MIRTLSGVQGTIPMCITPADTGIAITVPTATPDTNTTLYTVPANTRAVIRHIMVTAFPTAGMAQSYIRIKITRSGFTTIPVWLYSQTGAAIGKEIHADILLGPGDTVIASYSNTDATGRVVYAYVLIDTIPA